MKFCAYDGSDYQFPKNAAPDCYVKQGEATIGYFQTMKLCSDQLHIEHFAVDSSQIGNRNGAAILQEFVALVKEQAPQVQSISFDLGRATSCSDIAKLAQARVDLFNKVGAINVQKKQPRKDCIVVSATWDKCNW